MKKLIVVALSMSLLALPEVAVADHKPNAWCSQTGDICLATKKIERKRRLTIATAAKYFDRFRVCVTAPDDSTKCKEFEIYKEGPIYVRSVKWRRHFPNKGDGAYDVKWKGVNGEGRYGRTLGFHVG